MLIFKKEIRI